MFPFFNLLHLRMCKTLHLRMNLSQRSIVALIALASLIFIYCIYDPKRAEQERKLNEVLSLLIGRPLTCKPMRTDEEESGQKLERLSPIECKKIEDQLISVKDGLITIHLPSKTEKSPECFLTPFGFNDASDFEPGYGEPVELKFRGDNQSASVGPFQYFTMNHEVTECREPQIAASTLIHCNSVIPPTRVIFRENFFNTRFKSYTADKKRLSLINTPTVILLGIETMTLNKMQKLMPETVKMMKKLDFVEFKGHTPISDDSFANMMAMMTGKRAFDVMDFAAELPTRDDAYFDSWPLIWKQFSKEHYTTLFAEDHPERGIFNFQGSSCGFKVEPVDYYLRPFWISTIWSLNGRKSSDFCYKSQTRHAIQMNYLKDVLAYRKRERIFAISYLRELALSSPSSVSKMDMYFADFLLSLTKRRNTLIFVFSDQGGSAKEGEKSSTPFLSIRIPPAIAAVFPNRVRNLKINAQERTTTHYDVHETLVDIAKGFKSVSQPSNLTHGTSLFTEISPERSCGDAGIPSDKCACYIQMDVPQDEGYEPAEVVVSQMNEIIRTNELEKKASDDGDILYDEQTTDRYMCAAVKLAGPLSVTARILSPSRHHPVRHLQYKVRFKTASPLNRVYEGVVVRDDVAGKWMATEDIQLIGSPPPSNASLCVLEPMVKTFCYCLKKTEPKI